MTKRPSGEIQGVKVVSNKYNTMRTVHGELTCDICKKKFTEGKELDGIICCNNHNCMEEGLKNAFNKTEEDSILMRGFTKKDYSN